MYFARIATPVRWALCCALVIASASGCTPPPASTVPDKKISELADIDAEKASVPSQTPADTAVTDAEAAAFTQAWVDAIHQNDLGQFELLVDWRGIQEKTIDSLDVSAEFRAGFLEGAQEAQMAANLLSQLHSVIQNGGSYRTVRVVTRAGEYHAVFRLIDPQSGMNYHDLHLARKNERVIGQQFFVAATGESLSDSMRNVVSGAVAQEQSVLGQLTGETKRAMDDLDKQQRMSAAIQAGSKDEALRIYDSMSDTAKHSKLAMLFRVMATNVENEQAYLTAIDEYAAQFPNDPSLGLITLDAGVLRKDLELLEFSRQSLHGWTGGDAYVDLMIGGILANFGHPERAVEITRDIDPASIGIPEAHDYKLAVALAAQNFPEALQQLRTLRDDYGFEFTDLREAAGFEGFVNSPEFAAWESGE